MVSSRQSSDNNLTDYATKQAKFAEKTNFDKEYIRKILKIQFNENKINESKT